MLEKRIIDTVEKLGLASKNVPKVWDGRESILEMKDAGFKQWRQIEWVDSYFKFLCQKHFNSIIDMPGQKYGSVRFDAFCEISWDFKTHAANTTSYNIVTNDVATITDTIRNYSYYGMILAIGNVEYDKDKTFKRWHDELRKEIREYEINRINTGVMSQTRKTVFVLEEIHFICFDNKALDECCGIFQASFGDSGSRLKRQEIIIDIRKIPNASVVATEIFYGKAGYNSKFHTR